MNSKEARQAIEKLYAEKRRLARLLDGIKDSGSEDSFVGSVSELSVYDNHPADIGTETFERSKDIALQDNIHGTLENIEQAIRKVSDGTYGKCEECGHNINPERLQALPWATKCVKCQSAEERHDYGSTKRPLEESVLNPPFQRTFLDDSPAEFVGFDGEDCLQAVTQYGSSDTPQDLPGSHDYDGLYLNHDESIGIVDDMDRFGVYYPQQFDPMESKKRGEYTAKTER